MLRIAILLLILAIAAYSTWYDRLSTTDWDETLWIGVFPVNADDSDGQRELHRLAHDRRTSPTSSASSIRRRSVMASRFDRPVRVDLYPRGAEKPPPHDLRRECAVATMWWSLRLRLYARRNSHPAGRAPPQIRVFVLYHDPTFTQSVPHSVGLQKGLVGVVHAYAERDMTRTNNVVIAHEILHTLGATDKYDPATLAPLYPGRLCRARSAQPRYPQELTEIMAGRYARGRAHLRNAGVAGRRARR